MAWPLEDYLSLYQQGIVQPRNPCLLEGEHTATEVGVENTGRCGGLWVFWEVHGPFLVQTVNAVPRVSCKQEFNATWSVHDHQ